MGKIQMKKIMNERGLSLVEVVASIVILTLILTTFMMMFLQSAKTNKLSAEIVDATYTAQTVMENIYEVSKAPDFENPNSAIKSLGYPDPSSPFEEKGRFWIKYEKEIVDKDIKIEIRLEHNTESLKNVIVEVYETPNRVTPRAKMQNFIVWEAD